VRAGIFSSDWASDTALKGEFGEVLSIRSLYGGSAEGEVRRIECAISWRITRR